VPPEILDPEPFVGWVRPGPVCEPVTDVTDGGAPLLLLLLLDPHAAIETAMTAVLSRITAARLYLDKIVTPPLSDADDRVSSRKRRAGSIGRHRTAASLATAGGDAQGQNRTIREGQRSAETCPRGGLRYLTPAA
jgi:hypothetical protein